VSEKIKAEEIYLKDLFGSKFLFEIPDFQRPFSWDIDNFDQLVGDIKDTISFNQDRYGADLEQYEPYFLGTLILWARDLKGDGSGQYTVIDGQQRLTSLTILIACLRDITTNIDFEATLQSKIFQKANLAEGTPECVRLQVRERERSFFRQYILEPGGTKKLNERELGRTELSQTKERVLRAVETFRKAFVNKDGQPDQDLVNVFIPYLLQKVALVYVSTDSLSSGFRLFNIINTRGLSLTNADLLKSENLAEIPEKERSHYTKTWEDIEEEIGSEELEMLIGFIRGIKLKDRSRQNMFDEFNRIIFVREPDFKGKAFVDYLDNMKDIYCEKIKDGHLNSGNSDKDTYYHNLASVMRDFLPFKEWMAAVLKFKEKFPNNDYLYEFLINFERKLVVEWVAGYVLTERLNGIYRVIKLIEEYSDPMTVLKHTTFHEELRRNEKKFHDMLNDPNFYNRGRTRVPKYILLRLDMEQQYNENLRFSYSGNITVEHVLPRNPTHAYWLERFDVSERLEWINRLGNLALLNNRKNPQAGNRPFPEKVKYYFEKKSDFSLTQELSQYEDWTPAVVEERHKKLVKEALKTWMPQA